MRASRATGQLCAIDPFVDYHPGADLGRPRRAASGAGAARQTHHEGIERPGARHDGPQPLLVGLRGLEPRRRAVLEPVALRSLHCSFVSLTRLVLSLLLRPIKAPGAHVAPVLVAECLSHVASVMPARGSSVGGSGGSMRCLLLLVEPARDERHFPTAPRDCTALDRNERGAHGPRRLSRGGGSRREGDCSGPHYASSSVKLQVARGRTVRVVLAQAGEIICGPGRISRHNILSGTPASHWPEERAVIMGPLSTQHKCVLSNTLITLYGPRYSAMPGYVHIY